MTIMQGHRKVQWPVTHIKLVQLNCKNCIKKNLFLLKNGQHAVFPQSALGQCLGTTLLIFSNFAVESIISQWHHISLIGKVFFLLKRGNIIWKVFYCPFFTCTQPTVTTFYWENQDTKVHYAISHRSIIIIIFDCCKSCYSISPEILWVKTLFQPIFSLISFESLASICCTIVVYPHATTLRRRLRKFWIDFWT